MNKKILVTGGTGYIGSHTVVELIQSGYEVEILDNLFNSKITVLDKIADLTGTRPKFYEVDLLDMPKLEHIFKENQYEFVIHFAGLKAVGESVEQPLRYYENNLTGTINLLKCMLAHGTNRLIFSSSATVYGDQGVAEFNEDMTTGVNISNPYGWTKSMIEQILRDVAAAHPNFSAILLRYFNPVGAHPSGLLGEDPNDKPNNLMPVVMKVATGEISELSIFGDDYPTPDGTCIRDYIHVVDLAQGHLAALKVATPGVKIYNLGTGHGTSVLEIISAFNQASGQKLPYKIAPRRPGDLPVMYANPTKAQRELNWQAHLTVADAMRDTLNYLSKNQQPSR